MSELVSLIKLVIDFFKGRTRDQKDERLRLEQEAWQWLERHLPFFEDEAQRVYSIVFQNSAEKIPAECSHTKYPFVEKISRFPLRDDSALKINFRRLEKKDRQKAWAISKDYVDNWDICIGKFPDNKPMLPYDMVKFEKTQKALKAIIL